MNENLSANDAAGAFSELMVSDNSDAEIEDDYKKLKPPPVQIEDEKLSVQMRTFQITVRDMGAPSHVTHLTGFEENSGTEELKMITNSTTLKKNHVPVTQNQKPKSRVEILTVKVENIFDTLSIDDDNDCQNDNENLVDENPIHEGVKKKTNKKKKRKKNKKNKENSWDEETETESKSDAVAFKSGKIAIRKRKKKIQESKPQPHRNKSSVEKGHTGQSAIQSTSKSERDDLITIEENRLTGLSIRLSAKTRMQILRDIRKINREMFGDLPREIARRREYQMLRSTECDALDSILFDVSSDDSDFDSDWYSSDFWDSDLEEYLNNYKF